jgi:type III secretory pathway component EscR
MSTTELIIILALTGYAVFQQTRKHEITGQSRFKLAMIYAIVGLVLGVHAPHSTGALALLGVSLLASLLIGYVRGTRSRMWRENGRFYSRGTVFTVGLFLGLIAFKFALGTVAYLTHIAYDSSMGEILLMIGLMVGVQAEISWRRAQAMGATKAPEAVTSVATTINS